MGEKEERTMPILEELKWNYNYNLGRYYKGVEYLEKNPKQFDKWITELIEIKENIDTLLVEIMKYQEVSEDEALTGFKGVIKC